jgi:hypothetical protein
MTLGKWAHGMQQQLAAKGWVRLVAEQRGTSNITATVRELRHKAARLLDHLRQRGAGVLLSTKPWSRERQQQAVIRGPHPSSQSEREFVHQEIYDFCRQGYWIVLPYSVVSEWPHLRISPLGVVPQRNRRPRLIVDYTYSQVNAETVKLAPPEAMQFGRTLQRIMSQIVHADPSYGPVKLGKIDIADGFYRVWLQFRDIPKLGVALPMAPGEEPLVAFPLALPMGWVESPPYFTALTETACDLANAKLREGRVPSQVHRLEGVANTAMTESVQSRITPGWSKRHATFGTRPHRPPLAAVDVYVDDFILLAQTRPVATKVLRAAFTAIDEVLRPLDPSDSPVRKEPASVKKLQQGDAHWSTRKVVLGWDMDTVAGTISLPPHRLDRLYQLLSLVQPPRKRLPIKLWHQLLGELRSMAPALPGSRGLFSVLQDALGRADKRRVRLNRHIFASIADFQAIADSLASRPTRLLELIPLAPSDLGACDACRGGMGGVWFDALDPTTPPLVWRYPFPTRIQCNLVTADHRQGSISISDLELTAILAHKAVLAANRHVHERTIWLASDNRAALSWANKGSATAVSARAYLLRLNALHQRHHRYVARHHYIPGPINAMADDASRLWHLDDHALLTHFDRTYPQTVSWQLRPLPADFSSSLIGALSRQPAPIPSAPGPRCPLGSSGRPFVPAWASAPTPWGPATPYLFSNCSHSATALANSRPATTLSDLGQWRTPYEMWGRRTPHWGPLTLA